MTILYFDHAATTPPREEVRKTMEEIMKNTWGNPSALHFRGQQARREVDKAHQKIASILGCRADEIIFTSGGTESNNLAIFGRARWCKKGHIITSKTEHHSVLHVMKQLEKEGFNITYLTGDTDGKIDPQSVEQAIQKNTILLSFLYANNEVGTINSLTKIGRIANKHHIPFHTDAVQAPGLLPLDVNHLKVDMMSLSGHKCYGPKGVGVLYLRNGISITPQLLGGSQEQNRRASTENVPGIAGCAVALELASEEMETEQKKLTKLRDFFLKELQSEIPDIKINGHLTDRLANNINISLKNIEGESALLLLDMAGICASTGSACTSGSLDHSHVLMAMNVPQNYIGGTLRFSLGKTTTKKDIITAVLVLKKIVKNLRSKSRG